MGASTDSCDSVVFVVGYFFCVLASRDYYTRTSRVIRGLIAEAC